MEVLLLLVGQEWCVDGALCWFTGGSIVWEDRRTPAPAGRSLVPNFLTVLTHPIQHPLSSNLYSSTNSTLNRLQNGLNAQNQTENLQNTSFVGFNALIVAAKGLNYY
jgi:hypothetical protein